MNLPVKVSGQARADLRALLAYFKSHDSKTAARFRTAVREGFAQISQTPGLGRVQDFGEPTLAGMRMWRVPHFDKYLIFYRPFDDRIEIVHVVYGARDLPQLFRSRP